MLRGKATLAPDDKTHYRHIHHGHGRIITRRWRGETSLSDRVEAVEAALARGDLLAAFDLASAALAAGARAPRLFYLQTLALARMGEARRALAVYEAHGLGDADDIDSLSLRGRLLKDLALTADPAHRPALYREAGEVYAEVHQRTGGYFPAINAASLALLAGDHEIARARAEAVLAMAEIVDAADYFSVVSRAEAYAVLRQWAAAGAAIDDAVVQPGADAGARSSTLRQFRLLTAQAGLDADDEAALLAPLRPPPTMVYAGHIIRGGDAGEQELARDIAATLDELGIMVGYGGLAAGADIMFAEALLARGGELNIVLPFARDDYVEASVAPAGPDWIARFEACIARAASCSFASEAGFVADDNQFNYGSRLAMGLARLRAGHLGGDAVHVVVWDGKAPGGRAGTAIDIAAWQALGGATRTIALPVTDRWLDRPMQLGSNAHAGHGRELRAIIFSDFAGFSKLDEAQLPIFWRAVMGTAGGVLARHGDRILSANSWGDALFAVTADVASAADVALDLQATLARIDAPELGIGSGAGMRFGVHYGPVYVARDPITGRDNIFGTEVTRTARIEPITPTGEVYVTRPFAAILAMDAPGAFETAYVGTVALAKGYGTLQMYRLTRA